MRFLNLTSFKHQHTNVPVTKAFINMAQIVSVTVYEPEHPYTTVQTTEGYIELEGDVSKPIMYQLIGREL